MNSNPDQSNPDQSNPAAAREEEETAVVSGALMEINWACGTAELHRYHDRMVPLRFKPALNAEMRRFGNRFVQVTGHGRLDDTDQWKYVQVIQLSGERTWNQPFDLDAFLNNPNRRVFDPAKVVRASEPFDVDEFIRFIRSSREDRNIRCFLVIPLWYSTLA